MVNREERDKILAILERMRSITLAVQVIPFIYTGLYIIALICYLFASENVLTVIDTFLYVSPVMVVAFLVESRILKLCKWHKMACALPLLPQVSIIIDRYFHELCVEDIYVHFTVITLMAVLLLVAAYKVFLSPKRNGRKRGTDRDS